MYQHAQDLEFELAADKRDKIDTLRKQFISNSSEEIRTTQGKLKTISDAFNHELSKLGSR